MKKIIFSIIALMIAAQAFGQDLLRYNYKRNNFVYTGAERVEVASSPALQLKLGRVIYPDGKPIYTLRIDFESESAWKMPKKAGITFNLSNGRSVVLNNSKDDANLVAPKGISKGGRTLWLNCGEYYLEQSDLDKLLGGVSDLDATVRMSADGHLKISFKNNGFSAALSRAYNAIDGAKAAAVTVGRHLETIDDYSGNRVAKTVAIEVGESVSVSLSYLYSADGNSESYDLNLKVNSGIIPGGSVVSFTTPSGTVIRLRQEKDLPKGEIVCFPDVDQLKALAHGASKISFETETGERSVSVSTEEFASSVETLYNALQRVSIL
ncbi:MAG: hypothetical protein IJ151_03555 [Bacteroidales bacterium]|nr:hypothetical protein [Bacteroidales bacterium]